MQYRSLRVLFALTILFTTFISTQAQLDTNLVDECVTDFDESVDYFPNKVDVEYAEGFSVEYYNNYKVVEITPWQFAEETVTYLLVQCGTPTPELMADAIIEVPVNSFVSMSTSFLPHLETQDLLDNLVAVDTLLYSNLESVLALQEDLALIGGGGSFDETNIELLLDLDPDLVMTQQFSAGGTTLSTIESAGLNVVLNGDFADTSPLGQAEWGKYLALFFNTEAAANEAFEVVATEYAALKDLTADVPNDERPTVIANSPFDGTWYMPAGDSTVSQLIEDAGGNFLFSDSDGSSLVIDFESVFEEGGNADLWVNVNQFWVTTDDALADDPRYAEFTAFENGNMWNNNLIQNENGGSGYFELGQANPHLILADLITIFYPDLLPEHEFVFYQPLTAPEAE